MPDTSWMANQGGPRTGGPFKNQDFQRIIEKGAANDVAGVVTINFRPVPVGMAWLIERIAISTNSGLSSLFNLYENSVDGANVLDSSLNGNQDIADENSPVYVPPQSFVIAQWTNCTVGATVGKIRLQYVVVRL